MGVLQFARVGDVLPAAAAQLLPDPPDQVRAAPFEAHYPHIKWGRESRGIEQKIPAIGSARK